MTNQLKKIQTFDIKIGKRTTVSFWFLPTLICAFFGGYIEIFLYSYLFALLHETAHILCAKLLSVKISKLSIYPFGISAQLDAGYLRNWQKEFWISFSGPFFSICMFWICAYLSKNYTAQPFSYLADINLALCLINLIPALPLDGGRLLKSLLTSKYGIIKAYNTSYSISRVLVATLLGIAIAVFFTCDFNFSLILISAFLLQSLCSSQRTLSAVAMREFLDSERKLHYDTSPKIKCLCFPKTKSASVILKNISYDRYYVIFVVDDDNRIIKTLTETEIITSLGEYGSRLKFSDI